MWGFFAGIVRFIPYVGPWLGAILPITLSLAVFPGWMYPLMIAGFYATIELITNMVLEPVFYGRSAGISEVGLIVALAFWTLVWGPVGLLLGTPLTVCLVVLAKHVQALEPLHVLIGEDFNENENETSEKASK
jgi:predicted PurR-regulated permease PerM